MADVTPCRLVNLRPQRRFRYFRRHVMSLKISFKLSSPIVCLTTALFLWPAASPAQDKPSSYAPVVITEDFESIRTRMEGEKDEIAERQRNLLTQRYDLSDRPASGVTMSGGKAVQEGVRVKLPRGVRSWTALAEMSADDI